MIHQGIRGEVFNTFLTHLISLSGLKPTYIDRIIQKGPFDMAFTHPSVDELHNYEALEFIGDSVLNKSIVSYVHTRFPKLMVPKGVKIMSRLKINLVSGQTYAGIAKRFSFGPFISLDMPDVKTVGIRDEVLEDVLEAFFGALETTIDELFHIGMGYMICFKIISDILNTTHISLEYEDLFDAKTRLKETIDAYKWKMGTIKYNRVHMDNDSNVETVYITRCFDGSTTIIGRGAHISPNIASQIAATEALKFFETIGIKRPIPDKFLNLVSLYGG
jgi:dsRNA-specific ribonuclease